MADFNIVIVSGTVPDFKDKGTAVYTSDIDNEQKARATLKLNTRVSKRQQDGTYKDENEVLTFTAWRKTAQTLAKVAKPGTGLIIQGHVTPSRKMTRNGQDILTQDGKAVWSGEGLTVDRITFMRDYSKRDGNNANTNAQSGGTEAAPFDPMAGLGVQAAAPAPVQQAAAPAFDFNPTDFPAGMKLPF